MELIWLEVGGVCVILWRSVLPACFLMLECVSYNFFSLSDLTLTIKDYQGWQEYGNCYSVHSLRFVWGCGLV